MLKRAYQDCNVDLSCIETGEQNTAIGLHAFDHDVGMRLTPA